MRPALLGVEKYLKIQQCLWTTTAVQGRSEDDDREEEESQRARFISVRLWRAGSLLPVMRLLHHR
jgi:hypothetical protein